MNKIRLFEMFAGYGGASFALKKANIPFECVGFSEIKTNAKKLYMQNHKGYNYGDCTQINPNELPDFDLLTGGFPCQDVSIAGKNDLRKGRTILFNEIIRIAEIKQPNYMLLENVKGITFKNHKLFFEYVKNELKRLGYYVQIRLLKSSDYGTPQKRERVFFICSKNNTMVTLTKTPLLYKLKDLLDDIVDEKYYLKEADLWKLENKRYRFYNITDNCINTLTAGHLRGWDDPRIKIGNRYRYLTPKERFRFMGFFNDEINIDGLSESGSADLSGNGWDINLVSKIFKEMFKNKI